MMIIKKLKFKCRNSSNKERKEEPNLNKSDLQSMNNMRKTKLPKENSSYSKSLLECNQSTRSSHYRRPDDY